MVNIEENILIWFFFQANTANLHNYLCKSFWLVDRFNEYLFGRGQHKNYQNQILFHSIPRFWRRFSFILFSTNQKHLQHFAHQKLWKEDISLHDALYHTPKLYNNCNSKWVIVVLSQFSNFSAISWWEQVNFQWDDDEVRFVLDQHTELDFYSASSLEQVCG